VFTEPFSSNERLLWLHYSGFQASCHIMLSILSFLIFKELKAIYYIKTLYSIFDAEEQKYLAFAYRHERDIN
jgi:hypothetical protein